MSLETVDWSSLPQPEDDGRADHLEGLLLPDLHLPSTGGADVSLAMVHGLAVVFCYPMTGHPERDMPDGWDDIPGARGCTPQNVAYRDRADELRGLGVEEVYGLSTQGPRDQMEAAERLGLSFPLLSDHRLELLEQLDLPTFRAGGETYLRRLTMILDEGKIVKVNYPVFPPDTDAQNVVDWLKSRKQGAAG